MLRPAHSAVMLRPSYNLKHNFIIWHNIFIMILEYCKTSLQVLTTCAARLYTLGKWKIYYINILYIYLSTKKSDISFFLLCVSTIKKLEIAGAELIFGSPFMRAMDIFHTTSALNHVDNLNLSVWGILDAFVILYEMSPDSKCLITCPLVYEIFFRY